MVKIDAHIHYTGDHNDCIKVLNKLDIKLLNVCVASTARSPGWRQQAVAFGNLAQTHPLTYAWCTAFDVPNFANKNYIDHVIVQLEQDFKAGAVACKIWKNIGMEIRKPSGEFLMVDDPLFSPLYEYLTKVNKPLLMHTGEPLACWQPISKDNPHNGYYSTHPEWHMYGKPDFPSHQDIIDSRDRVLEQHPNLKIIGAHLGSLEYDVVELAKRLDRYPNFSVDTSARTHDLAYQDRETVRNFFIDYQDRILFGTDIVQRASKLNFTDSQRQDDLTSLQKRYKLEFDYYETGDRMLIRDRETQGLALPSYVLDKFYTLNAERCYPGIN